MPSINIPLIDKDIVDLILPELEYIINDDEEVALNIRFWL